MNIDDFKMMLQTWVPIEAAGPHGELQQRERLQVVARVACAEHAGDLVEIGCLHGSTTVLLAQVARQFMRKVIAIDPWEIGTQNCDGGEYEIFCRNIEPYQDVVEVLRMRSDDPQAIKALIRQPLAFAFVDGLHTHQACTLDIANVSHAAVIAVDDLIWSEEVRRAFDDSANWLNRTPIKVPEFREAYLI